MADDNEIKVNVKITGDNSNLKKTIKESKSDTDSLVTNFAGAAKKIKGQALAVVAAIAGIGIAIASVVKQASKIQDFSTQFEVLTGSAAGAKKVIADLSDFAAGTPFQFADIAEAGKQLLGFGFGATEIKEKLQDIGNVSAAIGKPIQDISLIFGQVSAAGKLTGERLLQFQERAIPIGPAIAKTLGVAESSVKRLVSEGKVSFEDFQKSFKSLSQDGGFAFGALDKQSKTFSGAVSTLKDNISLLAAELGKQLLPVVTSITVKLTEITKGVKEWFRENQKESGAENLKDINEKLKNVNEQLRILNSIQQQNAGSKFFNSFLGGAAETEQKLKLNLQKRKDLLKEQADAERRIYESSDEFFQIKENERLAREAANNKIKVDNQKALDEELLALRTQAAEQRASEEEISAVSTTDKDAADILKLTEKLEAERQIKLEKQAQELEDQGKHDKALEILRADFDKKDLKAKQDNLKSDGLIANKKAELAVATANLLVAIGGSQNKALFLISKAAGIAQILVASNVAATQALAVPPAPNVGLATLTKGIGYANAATVAATAIQGFASGGVAQGGVAGKDSIPAMLQRREIVAPATSFDEVIGSVRAKREAEKLTGAAIQEQQEVNVNLELGFTDDAFKIIEQKLQESRALGI